MYAVVIGEWYTQVFGLAATIGAHPNITVGATGLARFVHRQTEGGVTGSAVIAKTTGNIEWHDHPVTNVNGGDAGADFFNNAHVFVAKGNAGFSIRAAFIHVQI